MTTQGPDRDADGAWMLAVTGGKYVAHRAGLVIIGRPLLGQL